MCFCCLHCPEWHSPSMRPGIACANEQKGQRPSCGWWGGLGGHLGPFWGAFGVHKGCTGTDSREWDGACPQAGRVRQARLLGGHHSNHPALTAAVESGSSGYCSFGVLPLIWGCLRAVVVHEGCTGVCVGGVGFAAGWQGFTGCVWGMPGAVVGVGGMCYSGLCVVTAPGGCFEYTRAVLAYMLGHGSCWAPAMGK